MDLIGEPIHGEISLLGQVSVAVRAFELADSRCSTWSEGPYARLIRWRPGNIVRLELGDELALPVPSAGSHRRKLTQAPLKNRCRVTSIATALFSNCSEGRYLNLGYGCGLLHVSARAFQLSRIAGRSSFPPVRLQPSPPSTMKKYLVGFALAGAALAFVCSGNVMAQTTTTPVTTTPGTRPEHHPAIHAAIRALERAREELRAANHDFGGHRAEALAECDRAIGQLRLALQYDHK